MKSALPEISLRGARWLAVAALGLMLSAQAWAEEDAVKQTAKQVERGMGNLLHAMGQEIKKVTDGTKQSDRHDAKNEKRSGQDERASSGAQK